MVPSATTTRDLQTLIVRDQAALDALGPEWDELHRASPAATPFQTHAWVSAWASAYLPEDRLRVAVVRSGGRLVAAAPLHLDRRGPWPVLAPLGGELSDMTDVLLAGTPTGPAAEDVVRALTSALLELPDWVAVDLPEVPPGAAAHAWSAGWPGRTTLVEASRCLELPAVPLPQVLTRMPSGTAGKVRRKLRKADALGLVVTEVQAAEVAAAVPTMVALHEEQWRGRGGNPEHLTERFSRLLTSALPGMVQRGTARLVEYRLDGEVMVSQILLVGHDVLAYWLAGISPRLRTMVDVAAVLTRHDVELAAASGASRYSMLRGMEEYKTHWRPDAVQQHRLVLARPGPLGDRGYGAAVRGRARAVVLAKERAPGLRAVRDRVVALRRPAARPGVLGSGVPGAAWDALGSRSAGIGGSDWLRAWSEVYGADHRATPVVVGPPGSPRAVAPLVRRRRRLWTAEMAGVRELTEPTDVRYVDDAAARELARALAGTGLPLRLKRMPSDSSLLPHLREAYGHRALVLTREVTGTPVIELDDSWRAPETHFSTRRRADFRSTMRRAEKLGAVELSVLSPTAAEVGPLWDEVVAVEAAGWKTAEGTALAVQPRMGEFYRRWCTLAAERGVLRLAFLRIDGRPAAVQVAVEQHGRFSLSKIGFDEDFARCSPGNLLMLHTVRWAAERGLDSFEFLGAEEPWTAVWCDGVRSCTEVQVYPPTWRSVPAAAEFGVELARRGARSVGAVLRSRWGAHRR